MGVRLFHDILEGGDEEEWEQRVDWDFLREGRERGGTTTRMRM